MISIYQMPISHLIAELSPMRKKSMCKKSIAIAEFSYLTGIRIGLRRIMTEYMSRSQNP